MYYFYNQNVQIITLYRNFYVTKKDGSHKPPSLYADEQSSLPTILFHRRQRATIKNILFRIFLPYCNPTDFAVNRFWQT